EVVVQVCRTTGNLDGIVVAVLDAPEIGHGAQGGQQRARTDQRNLAFQRITVESVVPTQRFDERGLDGDEQQYEIQRLHAGNFAVVATGQPIDVATQRQQVIAHRGLAYGLVLARHGPLPGDQRYL